MDNYKLYDAFEHLCADAFPDNATRGTVAVITAYFDATYNNPKGDSTEPPLYTLAAYVGTRANWRKFRKEWRTELAKKSLEYFHMTDFEFARSQSIAGKEIPKSSPFYGWTESEFIPFLQKLHRVINRKDKNSTYRLFSQASHIIKPDFDELKPDELKDDVQCRSYYVFNVVQILMAVAVWADSQNYHDPIHYVFANGDGEGENLERLFMERWDNPVTKNRFRLSKGYSLMPYGIEWMKGEPALQAADITAYEMHKSTLTWIKRGLGDMPKDELRKSISSLCRTEHHGLLYRKKELLESFADILADYHNKRKFLQKSQLNQRSNHENEN